MEKDKTRPQYPRRGGYCLTFSFSLPWFPLHSNNRPVDQTVTKGLSSSSKFSGSCVPTLQTLPWLSVSCPSPVVSLVPSGHSFHSLHVRISPLFPSSPVPFTLRVGRSPGHGEDERRRVPKVMK